MERRKPLPVLEPGVEFRPLDFGYEIDGYTLDAQSVFVNPIGIIKLVGLSEPEAEPFVTIIDGKISKQPFTFIPEIEEDNSHSPAVLLVTEESPLVTVKFKIYDTDISGVFNYKSYQSGSEFHRLKYIEDSKHYDIYLHEEYFKKLSLTIDFAN